MATDTPSLADELRAGHELRAGRRVVIFGLAGRADLNSLEAVILSGGDRSKSLDDIRLPVRVTVGDEKVLVRPRNLMASASLAMLGQDGLYACLLRLDPCSVLDGRLVCTSWRLHLSRLLGNQEWQATHLPLPALCRASAWVAATLRLDRMPGEARMSCADWIEIAEVEARTGVPASGARIYPESVEQQADAGNVPAVLSWLDGGGHVDARSSSDHGYTLLMCASEVGEAPLVEALLARRAYVDMRCRNYSQLTALMIAAQGAEAAIVKLLLDAGADATLKRKESHEEDALQMASTTDFEGMDPEAKEATVAALTVATRDQARQKLQPAGALARSRAFAPFVLVTPKEDPGAYGGHDAGAYRAPQGGEAPLAKRGHAVGRWPGELTGECGCWKLTPRTLSRRFTVYWTTRLAN